MTIPANTTAVVAPVMTTENAALKAGETVTVELTPQPTYTLGSPSSTPVTIAAKRPDKVGLYRAGTWHLDRNGDGIFEGCEFLDKCMAWLGMDGERPFVGDWNGDGQSEVGVYANGTWYLDWNGNGIFDGCSGDRCLSWLGLEGERPLVGDWNGEGKTDVGVHVSGYWLLDANGDGNFDNCTVDTCVSWFGRDGEIPLPGDWTGDGKTKLGVYWNGTWVLDKNNNKSFDGCSVDTCVGLGDEAGDIPIVGKWRPAQSAKGQGSNALR